MGGESKKELFSVPSCTFAQWGTIIEQTATVCEHDSVFPTKSAEKTPPQLLPLAYIKALAYKLLRPAARTPATKGPRMQGAQIATRLCG